VILYPSGSNIQTGFVVPFVVTSSLGFVQPQTKEHPEDPDALGGLGSASSIYRHQRWCHEIESLVYGVGAYGALVQCVATSRVQVDADWRIAAAVCGQGDVTDGDIAWRCGGYGYC
jgi:hypothetical protein